MAFLSIVEIIQKTSFQLSCPLISGNAQRENAAKYVVQDLLVAIPVKEYATLRTVGIRPATVPRSVESPFLVVTTAQVNAMSARRMLHVLHALSP